MLSAGMLTDFASATIVRRRGLVSMSPPPFRAATVNSLMMRVKILPRLASAAPFLCLMVCHLEWPDMIVLAFETGADGTRNLSTGAHENFSQVLVARMIHTSALVSHSRPA